MAEWESAIVDEGWESPATVNPNLQRQGLKMEDVRSGMEFVNQRDPGID